MRLTLWFYCGKRAARRHRIVGEPRKSRVLLGCGAVVRRSIAVRRARPDECGGDRGRQSVAPAVRRGRAPDFPVASDVRLAGDAKQTRFILDLDKTIQFRAFALADPYRVVVDIPQVNFQLPAGAGQQGRGLIKAFRYGLVMPGGSRIVFDLTGPARIANSYVLDAANGQPPRLVVEFEEVDRPSFVQSLAAESRPELRPAIADAAEIAAAAATARPPRTGRAGGSASRRS